MKPTSAALASALKKDIRNKAPYPSGAVVKMIHTPEDIGYTYAAVHHGGRWYITGDYGANRTFGGTVVPNDSFLEVVANLKAEGKLEISLATEFTEL